MKKTSQIKNFLKAAVIMIVSLSFILPGTAVFTSNIDSPNYFTFAETGVTIYVDDSGGQDYTSIQEAIDNANDGDTIFVYSGKYFENLFIDKTITLTGENKDSTIIDGGKKDSVIVVIDDEVNISGFTITHCGVELPGSVIYIKSDNNNISNNIISADIGYELPPGYVIPYKYFCYGILLENEASNNIIYNNFITGLSIVGVYIRDRSFSNIVKNNVIEMQRYGIDLQDTSSNIVYGNEISDCASAGDGSGVCLFDATDNNIYDNILRNNNNCGILLTTSNAYLSLGDTGILEEEQLFENDPDRIINREFCDIYPFCYSLDNTGDYFPLAPTSGNRIENNIIRNSDKGIQVLYSNNNIFSENIIDGVCEDWWPLNRGKIFTGFFMAGSQHNTITHNKFINNDGLYMGDFDQVNWSTHVIDGNTVDGKPVYFYKNDKNKVVPSDAGQVIIYNCSYFSIENTEVLRNIQVRFSSHITVSDVKVSGYGLYGVHFIDSSYCTVSNSNILNKLYGVVLKDGSYKNDISSNIILDYEFGIDIRNSNENVISYNIIGESRTDLEKMHWISTKGMWLDGDYNIIHNNSFFCNIEGLGVGGYYNTIIDNGFYYNSRTGIHLVDGAYNDFYHNNFFNNGFKTSGPIFNHVWWLVQSYIPDYQNWDNGYPSGGNSWDDYDGVDRASGPNQDIQFHEGLITTLEIGLDGEITEPVLDRFEFDNIVANPQIIKISNDINAVVYQSNYNDGILATVEMTSEGDVSSVVDTYDFCDSDCYDLGIIQNSDDIFTIFFRDYDFNGFLKTVRIHDNGVIDGIIDSLLFNSCVDDFDIIQIADTDYYAIAFKGPDSDGFLKSVQISSDGMITDTENMFEFAPISCLNPKIIHVANDVYAILHHSCASRENNLKTVTIMADGTFGDVIDSIEIGGWTINDPNILHLSGDIFLLGFNAMLQTVSISTNGAIGNIVDEIEFDNGVKSLDLIQISDETFAITYQKKDLYGYVKTVSISNNGNIDSIVDSMQFDIDHKGYEPDIIQVDSSICAIAYRNASSGSDGIGDRPYDYGYDGASGYRLRPSDRYPLMTSPVYAYAHGPYFGVINVPITFQGSAYYGNPDYSYYWDFKDGTTSTEQNPEHTFTSQGNYAVTLTVTDSKGNSNMVATHVEIVLPFVTASTPFERIYDQTFFGVANFSTQFNADVFGGVAPYTWKWDFSDGSDPVFERNTTHVFTHPGKYHVKLTATDDEGFVMTDFLKIVITPEFIVNPHGPYYGAVDKPFIMMGSASGAFTPYTEWYWDFGDGNTSYEQNPLHTYVNEGEYTVSLKVTDFYGIINKTISTKATIVPCQSEVSVDDDYNSQTPGFGVTCFKRIQNGLNVVKTDGTVDVSPGTYYEQLHIIYPVNLRGHNRELTIIDGNYKGTVITVVSNWVSISEFTIRNAAKMDVESITYEDNGIEISSSFNNINGNIIMNNNNGFVLQGASRNTFSDNNIMNMKYCGISCKNSYENIFNKNVIKKSSTGILLLYSSNNIFSKNVIKENERFGFYIIESHSNRITDNIIRDNKELGIKLGSGHSNMCNDNHIYRNIFANNTRNALDCFGYWDVNSWDNGYPSGGNFWDDYTGEDSNNDGIGDTPYDVTNNELTYDRYPLMSDIFSVNAGGPYNGYPNEQIEFNGFAHLGVEPYTYEWDFGDGVIKTGSTVANAYEEIGDYTVTLKVTDNSSQVAIDVTTVHVAFAPKSGLECDGKLSWSDVQQGSNITGNFTIKNSGESGSLLNWEILVYPEWGDWTFDPESGNDLEAGDEIEVSVFVVAPEESKKLLLFRKNLYDGKITIVNKDNPNDKQTIDVSMSTPRAKHTFIDLFISYLNQLLERFPRLERLFSRLPIFNNYLEV